MSQNNQSDNQVINFPKIPSKWKRIFCYMFYFSSGHQPKAQVIIKDKDGEPLGRLSFPVCTRCGRIVSVCGVGIKVRGIEWIQDIDIPIWSWL